MTEKQTLNRAIIKWWCTTWLGVREDRFTCPLCFRYGTCIKCPVMKDTGKSGCYGTPYWDYSQSHPHKRRKLEALAELNYLKKLKRDVYGKH